MTKLLVTGVYGLLGRTLVNALKATTEYDVIGMDNRLPKSHKHYGDVLDKSQIAKKLEGVDGVIHLAAVSRVIWAQEQPELCWQTNVEATQEFCRMAEQLPSEPWIIYASSREVYGQQTSLPVDESAARKPVNIYARSKLAAEDIMQQSFDSGLTGVVLRFSSVYGRADDHKTRVMPAFVRAAILNEPIRVDGLDTTLDFTYVEDVVQGIVQVIARLNAGGTLPTMHFTSNQGTKLIDLANMIKEITSSRSAINIEACRNYDVEQFFGSHELATNVLNWYPKTELAVGIRHLITQFQQTLKQKVV